MSALPRPFVRIGFLKAASLSDCLRSAWQHARLHRVAVQFRHDSETYTVQPEMPIDDVLAMTDAELALSVRAHIEVHGG